MQNEIQPEINVCETVFNFFSKSYFDLLKSGQKVEEVVQLMKDITANIESSDLNKVLILNISNNGDTSRKMPHRKRGVVCFKIKCYYQVKAKRYR